ncbi:hypothetical protein LTR94_037672, partial [Friedmanniomyces endolithicus]
MAPPHGNGLDRVGHVGNGNAQEALGRLLGRNRAPGRRVDLRGQFGEAAFHRVAIERFVAIRPEH